MDERDAQVAMPRECRVWCRAQQYGVTVLDDMAVVNLDWWNHRLTERGLAVRLAGRDADGAPTHHGVAVIARGDLTTASDVGDGALGEVGVLYAAAAWLSAHRNRDRARRFSDVRTPARSGDAYDAILTALHACRHPDVLSAPPIGSGRRWSGWPHAPGVGPTVLSLYCWATHHRTGAAAAAGVACPQLLDQQAVNSLLPGVGTRSGGGPVHLGALHPLLPPAAHLGRRRRRRPRADRNVAGGSVARTRRPALPRPRGYRWHR